MRMRMAIMVFVVGSACHGRGGGGRRGRACGEVMAAIEDVGRVDSDCCHYNRGRATRRDTSSKGGRGSRGGCLCGWSFLLAGPFRFIYIPPFSMPPLSDLSFSYQNQAVRPVQILGSGMDCLGRGVHMQGRIHGAQIYSHQAMPR